MQNMTGQPLVTAIAVCYNHARFVTECLDSIRNQTYPNVQIIIMDDCSKDESVKIIQDWVDRHAIDCSFIAHSQNQGLCRTLNEALERAKGKYISLIATDDTWLPEKIQRQVSIMETLPEHVGIVYSDAYRIDEHGHRLSEMFIESHRKFSTMPEGDLTEDLIVGNFIPAMATLIRHTVYERVGRYDENLAFEDWDFWLRAANRFHFSYCPYPSANYRILETSMARTLLAKANAKASYTYYLINDKILATPGLSISSRTLAAKRLSRYARGMYLMNHPKAARALIRAFMSTRQVKDLYWAVLGFLRIPHKRYQRVASYLRWRFNRRYFRVPFRNKGR
jgi:glycosyltransferase involved in cell wall biosynthesis